jgi:hypothetical protein
VPASGQRHTLDAHVPRRRGDRLQVSIEHRTRPGFRFGYRRQHPLAPQRSGDRHAGQNDPVGACFGERLNVPPEQRQLVLHSLGRIVGYLEIREHQHHAIRRDPIELVRHVVDERVRRHVPQAIPGLC